AGVARIARRIWADLRHSARAGPRDAALAFGAEDPVIAADSIGHFDGRAMVIVTPPNRAWSAQVGAITVAGARSASGSGAAAVRSRAAGCGGARAARGGGASAVPTVASRSTCLHVIGCVDEGTSKGGCPKCEGESE